MKNDKLILQPFSGFRKSMLFNFTVYFLSMTLLFVSCTTDTVVNYHDVPDQTSTTSNIDYRGGESSMGLYSAMEMVRTTVAINGFETTDELLAYFGAVNEEAKNAIAELKAQTKRYEEVGYDQYVNDHFISGNISANMNNWLTTFKSRLNSFIETSPDQNDFERFLNNSDNFYFNDQYSSNELLTIERTVEYIKDAVKYQYLHYDSSDDFLRAPDCSFLEKLGCWLLYLVVVVAILIIVFAILFVAITAILALGGIVLVGGAVAGPGTGAAVVEILIAVMLTDNKDGESITARWENSFYEWCCGKKEKEVCEAPTGAYYNKLGCNSFEYVIYGPSDYTLTLWANTNTDPSTSFTYVPKLIFSIPNYGTVSNINADLLCIEFPSGSETHFGWVKNHVFLSDSEFNITWNEAPPTSISISDFDIPQDPDDVFVSVKPDNSNLYSYIWTCSAHTIYPNGADAIIELDTETLGSFTTTVIITNNCTGESQTISKTTNLTL